MLTSGEQTALLGEQQSAGILEEPSTGSDHPASWALCPYVYRGNGGHRLIS